MSSDPPPGHLAVYDSNVDPSAIQPVNAFKDRYGRLGTMLASLVAALQVAGTLAVRTSLSAVDGFHLGYIGKPPGRRTAEAK